MKKNIYVVIAFGFIFMLDVHGRSSKTYSKVDYNNELEETVRLLNGKIEELEQKIHEIEKKIAVLDKQSALFSEFIAQKLNDDREKILAESLGKKSPEEIIKTVENMIENKKFEDAIDLLNAFLKKNPKSIYCGIMLFYLGNSYADSENYKDAAMKYMESYKTNPKGRKACEALYNLAACFGKLNKKEQQKSTLEKLLRDYGANDWAAKAKKSLADLK
jgi:tol-pal system protein YbgF